MEKNIETKKSIYVKCVGCGDEFILEAKEQEWYESRQLFIPKRCPACRLSRKLAGKKAMR